MLARVLLLVPLLALHVGCDKDARAEPLPLDASYGGGGFGGVFGGGGRPADEDAGERRDAATSDTPFASGFAFGECVQDEGLPTVSNVVFMPADFPVTRGYAHWIGSCSDPVLEIGLSEGRCPNGSGHELTIQIDGDAINDGTLTVPGANQLQQERPDLPIRVRYQRPSSYFPAGTWGTCDGVFGELTVESLDITRDAELKAVFGMTLAACDTFTTTATIAISGSFDLDLERGIRELCPTE